MKKRPIGFAAIVAALMMLMGLTLTGCDLAPGPCRGYAGKVLCAIESDGRVYLVNNGIVTDSGSARFGGYASDGSGYYATRHGQFRIFTKGENVWSNLYGVNMPFFMGFSGGQGFHYSQEYANGYPYSHGCVGFSSWSFAQRAYVWAPIGTRVIVS